MCTGLLLGAVYMGGGTGRLPGRTFFIPALKTVYMEGGTGRFSFFFVPYATAVHILLLLC